jgi:hypothetical protein
LALCFLILASSLSSSTTLQWHEKEKRETNPGSSSAESNGIQKDLSVFEMSMIGLFGHPVSGQGTAGVGLHFTVSTRRPLPA